MSKYTIFFGGRGRRIKKVTQDVDLKETTTYKLNLTCTVEPLFNEVLNITNEILRPGQSYNKMYEIKPRYNEPQYNKLFDITNTIQKPKRKMYLDITNYNVNTWQKKNAEQINSQHIL